MRDLRAVERRRQLFFLAALLTACLVRFLWGEPKLSHAQWEPQISAFEARDKTNPPPRGAILAIGSSSIQFWETLKQDFSPLPVVRRGFGGAMMSDVLAYADRIILPYEPRVVLLYAGENDLAGRRTSRQVLADFRELIHTIHVRLPDARIALISIKPSITRKHLFDRIRRANALLKAEAARYEFVDFIDVFTPMLDEQRNLKGELFSNDGLHLNTNGYHLWASLIKPRLACHAHSSAEPTSSSARPSLRPPHGKPRRLARDFQPADLRNHSLRTGANRENRGP